MIQINVVDAGVQQALSVLAARVRDMRPAMAEIGTTLADNIRLGFKSGSGPYGAWQPLKRARRLNRKAGDRGLPLNDTGRLRNSITYRTSSDSVEVGTNVVYAALHQFGGKTGRGHKAIVPARPFMPIRNGRADLPSAWRDEVIDIIRRRIAEATQ